METLTQEPPANEPPTDDNSVAPGGGQPMKTLAVPRANTIIATLAMFGMFGFGFWALADLKINLATLADSASNIEHFVGRMMPLDFPPIVETAGLVGQTLAIVIAATLLSMMLSIPLAFWSASNTALNKPTRFLARALVVCARAVPDVVMAVVFVRVLGLGILPGVLAMGFHSVGMIGKLYADAIEQVDEGPPTAIRATGAKRLQRLISGVFPQVLPAFVATAMHRLDINLRISVLLGFVGVAGIGKEIKDAIGRLDYHRAMALAAIVLVLCILMELISGAIRKGILGTAEPSKGGLLWLWKRGSKLRGGRGDGEQAEATRNGKADPAVSRVSPPWSSARIRRLIYMTLAGLVVASSVVFVVRDFFESSGGSGWAATLAQLWPPNTGGVESAVLADEMFTTIKVGFGATIIGMVLAVPIGLMAARNVAPNSVLGKCFRVFIVCVRGIPELILAIVFVIMIGLSEVAGTLALSIGAIGLLGKLIADSVEEVDPGPEYALKATGATRIQVFFAATLPQALPAFVGHLLYQLDVNIRSATLLGIVGAGGIGYYLLEANRVREFGTVTLITMALFIVVMTVELIAIWLRRTAGAKGASH